MRKQLALWFFLILLAGCGPQSPAAEQRPPMPATFTPIVLPTAVVTLAPAPVITETAAPSALAAPTEAASTQAAAPAAPLENGTLEFAVPEPAPFNDCTRTPGLVICDPAATGLTGWVSYYDSQAGRLVSLHLGSGAGWQVPLEPARLSWSTDGTQLLADVGERQHVVFGASGRARAAFEDEQPPAWQPDGRLSRAGAVHSPGGRWARLEMTEDFRWLLRVRANPDTEEEAQVEVQAQPADRLYLLRGWLPDGQRLLGQAYFASNAAMTQGGQLITIDPASGAMQEYMAGAALNEQAKFRWSPAEPNLMAFLDTSQAGVDAPRLALLDFNTGQVRYPLPDGLAISDLAWRPDGQRLAFVVQMVGEISPADARQNFPGPGLYLLDPVTGAVERLAETPEGAQDGWLHWMTNGQALLYGRQIIYPNGELAVEVRARWLAEGVERVLVQGLRGPDPLMGGVDWPAVLAYGR